MSGDLASQTSLNTGPEQTLAGNAMAKEIETHKKKLEEIKALLKPGNRRNILNKDVGTYKNDISGIYDYLEGIKGTGESFKYISSVANLLGQLDEIISELDDALDAWDVSYEAEKLDLQRLDTKSRYRDHLRNCYGLLGEALSFFILVEQVQQGTTTKESDELTTKS